jgi:hypothetical protein
MTRRKPENDTYRHSWIKVKFFTSDPICDSKVEKAYLDYLDSLSLKIPKNISDKISGLVNNISNTDINNLNAEDIKK